MPSDKQDQTTKNTTRPLPDDWGAMRNLGRSEQSAPLDNEVAKSRRLYRTKLVASILTDHGLPVTPPDEATLDDVERERWEVCVQIEKAMSET